LGKKEEPVKKKYIAGGDYDKSRKKESPKTVEQNRAYYFLRSCARHRFGLLVDIPAQL
jgi:hypothetical protein